VLQQWINRDKDIKMLKKLICKRLKGEVTFTDVMWKEYSHCFASICRGFAVNAEFLKGVQPNDVSVIYNTQCLRIQYLQAMDEDKCCALVYFVLKKAGRKVHLSAPDSSGPQMNLEMAEQLLDLKSEKWTLETLKAKIPEECKTAINRLNRKEICPDIEAGYHDIIKAFEV